MAIATLCDGSKVEYDPKYSYDECFECGAIRQVLTNEPSFHGESARREDGRAYCTRCNEDLADLISTSLEVSRVVPKVVEEMTKPNLFYRILRGSR